jgi:hypothetical protein
VLSESHRPSRSVAQVDRRQSRSRAVAPSETLSRAGTPSSPSSCRPSRVVALSESRCPSPARHGPSYESRCAPKSRRVRHAVTVRVATSTSRTVRVVPSESNLPSRAVRVAPPESESHRPKRRPSRCIIVAQCCPNRAFRGAPSESHRPSYAVRVVPSESHRPSHAVRVAPSESHRPSRIV